MNRTIRPYTAPINCMAELETPLRGYSRAYNVRPQEVLPGKRPTEIVREHCKHNRN